MSKQSGKSAKLYRIERDIAREALTASENLELVRRTDELAATEESIKRLQANSRNATDSLIFKATGALIAQNRLIKAQLSGDRFYLEFKL